MSDFRKDCQRYKSLPGYRGMVWWMLDQSFWVILTYRLFAGARGKWFHAPLRVFEKIAEFVFKCYLPTTARIGPGLVIYHAFGVIINGKSEIGPNCTLYARVCIGNRWPGDGTPIIGANVTIGTGACIFGPVHIPDNYTVKANAVITPSTKLFH
jgi:serine O-acetyltransferase